MCSWEKLGDGSLFTSDALALCLRMWSAESKEVEGK